MKRGDFRHLERLRVRWAEVDAQRVVFNGHYLLYFDTAMAGYWRALALPYEQTLLQLGGDLYVRKATLEYSAPAHFDEQLDIGLRCAAVGTTSLKFEGGVFHGERLLVGCELVNVFTDATGMQAAPVPTRLRETLEAFEAGAVMVDLRVGSWAELGGPASALRAAVFIDEQRIPAPLASDAADETAVHAVAFNRFGLPLATGRLRVASDGVSRLARMAVRRDMRGGGVGRAVLGALLNVARERGDRVVSLQAQTSAVAFYRRAGFVTQGSSFVEAGIEHVEMSLRL